MKYTIGLDLGITSVGWAIVDENKKHIVDLGVRYFDKPENPKNGSSLAEPRRTARGQRRRLARRRGRLDSVKEIFKNSGLSKKEIDKLLLQSINPYELRAQGLNRALTPSELFIVVYHITKRRGYKSNRKTAQDSDKETGKVLVAIKEMKGNLAKDECRTVGEYLWKQMQNNQTDVCFNGVRNKAGSYRHSVTREMLEDELKQIFSTQQNFGNEVVTDEFIKSIIGYDDNNKAIGAFNRQRHYAEGNQLKQMVGYCTFEAKDKELRAAKATYAFQYSVVLQKINHIKIKKGRYGELRKLSKEERETSLQYILNTKTPHYATLRKELNLEKDDLFNMVNYSVRIKPGEEIDKEKKKKEVETKTKLPSMKTWMELRKLVAEADESFAKQADEDKTIYDKIAMVLTLYRTNEDVIKEIKTGDYRVEMPEAVLNKIIESGISFDKFGSLSLKALYKLVLHLEEGSTYEEAVAKAGYKEFSNIRREKLLPLKNDDYRITNPVVKRAVSQTIKVINAIVDKHGAPYQVNIELARDLAKNFADRNKSTKLRDENQGKNEKAKEEMIGLGLLEPKGQDIIKYRLYKEQDCKCAYSGNPIDENRLVNEDGYVQIDHIIPFSRSFDDSYSNKVLVLTKENQDKGNQTPFEMMGGNEEKWSWFEAFVNSCKGLSYRKKQNLLTKKYVSDGLAARALNDTRFISKFVKDYIEKGLLFSDEENKKSVHTVNGTATTYARKRWTLYKNRLEDIRHHAQDAAIVAVMNEEMMQQIMRSAKRNEIRSYLQSHKNIEDLPEINDEEKDFLLEGLTDRQKLSFVEPWEGFRYELAARMSDDPMFELESHKDFIPWFKNRDVQDKELGIKPIFVSHMPRRKVRGKLHDDTVRSAKRFEQEYSSVKVPLTSLTEKKLKEDGKFLDPNLVSSLLERLREFNGDAVKAFAEPFYKIMKNGERGPLVRSVRLTTGGQKSGILINDGKGLVDRQSMLRIDVFSKENNKGKEEFYFVPVYAYHRSQKELPNKVCTIGSSEKDWNEIGVGYIFKFSLYPGDLIKIRKKESEGFWYYVKAGISTASLTVENDNKSKSVRSIGIKTLDKFDKYVVYVLGSYHKVHHEKRMSL